MKSFTKNLLWNIKFSRFLQSIKHRKHYVLTPTSWHCKKRAHGCCCCQRLHFWVNMQQHLREWLYIWKETHLLKWRSCITYRGASLIFQATPSRSICMKSMQRSRTGHVCNSLFLAYVSNNSCNDPSAGCISAS